MGNVHKILIEKTEKNKPPARYGSRQADNIKTDVKQMGSENVKL
jgi:hypothetical protein